MSLKDFINLQKIGEGSYSSVHKVRRISDNQEYALKKVKLQGLSEKEKDNALNEIRILASITHPNMIGYKDAFFDETSHSLCIIMELAENGDLAKKIETAKKRTQFIPEEEIWVIALHMLRGLKAMHSKKILHRDLKCANVFASQNDEYKLGDLNVSKVAKRGLVYTQTGTPYYASPEVWRDEPYDSSSDLWSFGCIIYELAALNPPFRAKDMEGLYKKIQKGVFERIPQRYSTDLQKFISLCLQVNSSARPSVSQLLNNILLKRNTQFLAETAEEQLDKENTLNPGDLLGTIKMPKNLKQLREKLPKPQYNKELLNKSYHEGDAEVIERKNARFMSVKMSRIKSVVSHKNSLPDCSSFTGEDREDEGNDTVLPLISQKQGQGQPLSNNSSIILSNNGNGSEIIANSNSHNNNPINKYENSKSIVNSSRNYLQEIAQPNQQQQYHPRKRNLPASSHSQGNQNYNEDYALKAYQQQQQRYMHSPTISVVSRNDTAYGGHPQSAVIGNAHSQAQQQVPLRSRGNSINQIKHMNNPGLNHHNVNNNIHSYARIANLYQRNAQPVNYMPVKQSAHAAVDQNSPSRPGWWG